MERVKFGIVGYGSQGSFYAGLIKEGKVEGLDLVAIASTSKGEEIKKTYPDLEVFENYRDLVDSGLVEGLVICTPHYFHPEIASYALKRGVSVLNEKPAGVFTKNVRDLNELAEKSPASFAILFNQRARPLNQRLKALIGGGKLGELRRYSRTITNRWRPDIYYESQDRRGTRAWEGGGLLLNQACHQVDLLYYFFGLPEKVLASLNYGFQRKVQVEDQAQVIFEYESGARGVFISSTSEILGEDRLEAVFDRGKIILEDGKRLRVYLLKEEEGLLNEQAKKEDLPLLISGKFSLDELYEVYEYEDTMGRGEDHVKVLENFADHLLKGTPLLARGEEGLASLLMINGAYLSDYLERPVDLKNFDHEAYLDFLKMKISEEKGAK